MKSKAIKETEKYLKQFCEKEKAKRITAYAKKRFNSLCLENKDDPKAVKAHTVTDIYPCTALYEAMINEGIDKEEAVDFLDRTWSARCASKAKSTAALLKLFGLYKLYPAMFESVAKKQFGKDAGFKAKFYDEGKGHCRFDMVECLFKKQCEKYGHPELLKCFCHTDDINNRNLNPRLIWDRKFYMGKGDDLCDFNIYIKKDK